VISIRQAGQFAYCAIPRPAVNRLVAGSNPARGAKPKQALNVIGLVKFQVKKLFGAALGFSSAYPLFESYFASANAITDSLHRGTPAALERINMTDIQVVESTQTKKRGRARQQPDEAGQPDVINFDHVVTELKQIVARGSLDAWRVAELAFKVEPKYGDKTLVKLAKQLGGGIAACTLERRRSVFQAWKDSGVAAGISFAVAQELAPHPERVRIIAGKPNMGSREARKLMREYNQNKKQKDADFPLDEYRKWFRDVVDHHSAVYRDGQIVNDHLDRERLQMLREAIEPNLLPGLREAGMAAIKLFNFLNRLVDKKSRKDARTREGTGNHLSEASLT
jgi:hypothetical protein